MRAVTTGIVPGVATHRLTELCLPCCLPLFVVNTRFHRTYLSSGADSLPRLAEPDLCQMTCDRVGSQPHSSTTVTSLHAAAALWEVRGSSSFPHVNGDALGLFAITIILSLDLASA